MVLLYCSNTIWPPCQHCFVSMMWHTLDQKENHKLSELFLWAERRTVFYFSCVHVHEEPRGSTGEGGSCSCSVLPKTQKPAGRPVISMKPGGRIFLDHVPGLNQAPSCNPASFVPVWKNMNPTLSLEESFGLLMLTELKRWSEQTTCWV